MKFSQLKALLSDDSELKKYTAENVEADAIYSNHPIIETFQKCEEEAENAADKEQVAELILLVFGSQLSISDMKFLISQFPNLGEKIFKFYLEGLSKELVVNIDDFMNFLSEQSDKSELIQGLMDDLNKNPEVNQGQMRCILFRCRFNKLEGDAKLAFFKSALLNENLASLLYKKEEGCIYGWHPVMADFAQCAGANRENLAEVAEIMLTNYGNAFIFTDFEYLCQHYPEANEKIFANFVAKIDADEINRYLPGILRIKKQYEIILFIKQMLEHKCSTPFKYFRTKGLLAVFKCSLEFIDHLVAKLLFDEYIKNIFNSDESIYQSGFNLTNIYQYFTVLNTFLPSAELINVVGSSASTICLGIIDGITDWLEKLSEVVPEPLFLQMLDNISQTYSDIDAKKRVSPSPFFQEHYHIFAHNYRAKVDEFFDKFHGSSLQTYRENKKTLKLVSRESTITGLVIDPRLFAVKPVKPKVEPTASVRLMK